MAISTIGTLYSVQGIFHITKDISEAATEAKRDYHSGGMSALSKYSPPVRLLALIRAGSCYAGSYVFHEYNSLSYPPAKDPAGIWKFNVSDFDWSYTHKINFTTEVSI